MKICNDCGVEVATLYAHPRAGGLCHRCACKWDAKEIDAALDALLQQVAAFRERRGRDFIRSMRFGELLDRLDARAHAVSDDASVVDGLSVTVDAPEREGDLICVRYPGGVMHSRTRDEALFWAGHRYGRKQLLDDVDLLYQFGRRARVVVKE